MATISSSTSSSTSRPVVVMHWFRKGLRLADNPGLCRAMELSRVVVDEDNNNNHPTTQSTTSSGSTGAGGSCRVYPVYMLDPDSYQLRHGGPLRATFLLECLRDLDVKLRERHGSRLYVVPMSSSSSNKTKQKNTKAKEKNDPHHHPRHTIDEPSPSSIDVSAFADLWRRWNITDITCDVEETGEPYGVARDEAVALAAHQMGIRFHRNVAAYPQPQSPAPIASSETIFSLSAYLQRGDSRMMVPYTMSSFQKLFQRMGPVPLPLAAPTMSVQFLNDPTDQKDQQQWNVPINATHIPWPVHVPRHLLDPIWSAADCRHLTPAVRGGETMAMAQLAQKMKDADWVATFNKPLTSYTRVVHPNNNNNSNGHEIKKKNNDDVSTCLLSPYLSHGCISPRTVWHAVAEAIHRRSSASVIITRPPVSLHGQLLWREFNYLMAHVCNQQTPGSWGMQHQMVVHNDHDGGRMCRDIPWSNNPVYLNAWRNAQTGYPWIDAVLTELRQTGWIHHLGRHAIACFLTRGDLWQSWEKGAHHFECQLLDADYALNVFNWLWLSGSGFFYQYFRCYSPVAFAQKQDPAGTYVRRWLPVLARLPNAYIYQPWLAPSDVLLRAGVALGDNYPRPIVDHAQVSRENMGRMASAYLPYQASKNKKKEKGDDDDGNNNNNKSFDGKKEKGGAKKGTKTKSSSATSNSKKRQKK